MPDTDEIQRSIVADLGPFTGQFVVPGTEAEMVRKVTTTMMRVIAPFLPSDFGSHIEFQVSADPKTQVATFTLVAKDPEGERLIRDLQTPPPMPDAWRQGYLTGIDCANGEVPYPEKSPHPEGSRDDALWHLGFTSAFEDEYPTVIEAGGSGA